MRLTTLLLALALVGICAAALPSYHFSLKEAEQRFAKWAKEHGKSYIDREARKALLVFHHNLERIEEHNRKAAQGLKTFTMKLNKFADLTEEEFAERFLGFRYRPDKMTNPVHLTNETDVPDSVDWRTKGAVTPVKDQGQCGSCWAFSATGALEGANFLKTGKLVALSEQELLDCDGTDNACNGGLMDNAFAWVEKNGGIDSEDDWKYLGHETVVDKCPKAQAAKHVGTCSNYTDVVANNETQLMLAASKQPVSVAIEADQGGFQFYESGIFSGDCGTNLDHGVLLVGYGTEDKQDYWIVKNSWGDMWGEDGYIRIARNVKAAEGQCGIAMAASYPTA